MIMLYILCKETYILYKTIQNSEILTSVFYTGLCHWIYSQCEEMIVTEAG